MGWCEYQIKLHAEVNEWRKGIINFVAKIYRVTNTEKRNTAISNVMYSLVEMDALSKN
jgi:hypothetical protein